MMEERTNLNDILKKVIERGNMISMEVVTDDQLQYSKNLIKRIQELSLLDLGVDKELDQFLLDSAALSVIMMFHLKNMEESAPDMTVVKAEELVEEAKKEEEKEQKMKATISIESPTMYDEIYLIIRREEGIVELVKDIKGDYHNYTFFVQKASTRALIEKHLCRKINWKTQTL